MSGSAASLFSILCNCFMMFAAVCHRLERSSRSAGWKFVMIWLLVCDSQLTTVMKDKCAVCPVVSTPCDSQPGDINEVYFCILIHVWRRHWYWGVDNDRSALSLPHVTPVENGLTKVRLWKTIGTGMCVNVFIVGITSLCFFILFFPNDQDWCWWVELPACTWVFVMMSSCSNVLSSFPVPNHHPWLEFILLFPLIYACICRDFFKNLILQISVQLFNCEVL